MATQTTKMRGSGYGNPYIDSLVWGCKWMNGPVTYAFGPEGSSIDGQTSLNFTDAEKVMFRGVLQSYSNVCNIIFKEVPFALNSANDNIVEWKVNALSSSPGFITLGWHEVPDNTSIQNWGAFSTGGNYWSTSKGSLGYSTVVHELGHALGLAHPHDGGNRPDATLFPGVTGAFDSYGTYSMNQGIWTVMSYNAGWANTMPPPDWTYGDVITPMALDVAALQKIYGANNSYKTGTDAYTLPNANTIGTGWSCLWDAGGIDTIYAGDTSISAYINLNAAPLTGPNAGGYVSRLNGIYGGFTIANGVTIENAIGGNGNDTLIGNTANNTLRGGSGNDQLLGGLGKDTLYGGSGNDVFKFNSITESKIGTRNRDIISDFTSGDKIDISGIDAKTGYSSNDAFTFLGSTAPTNTTANGGLWFISGVLYGSTDNDVAAEFEIAVTGVTSLTSSDFIL